MPDPLHDEDCEHYEKTGPPLGDIVLVLLAGTLSGLRDRLADDGYTVQAAFVSDLTEQVDEFLAQVVS